MRLLLITQYFPPETGAAQNRLGDLSRRLASFSHEVTVLTALPNYPRGQFYEGYRGRVFMRETWNGVRVVRTWLYPTKSRKVLARLLNYLSFLPAATLVGLWLARKGDIVLVNSPPLFLGIAGVVVCRIRGARLVLNVADLWPASGRAIGVLPEGKILRWATVFEEFLYRHCALITGQTRGIVDNIRRRCPQVPVSLLTNGITPEFVEQAGRSRAARDGTRRELGWDGRFAVGYAGLHGFAQGLDLILQVGELLRETPDVIFALFGDGPEKLHLRQAASQMGLKNVRFYPQQPTSRMPEILAAMDAALVPLKRQRLFEAALPAKLFEAMGAGVPVIAALEGEARVIVEKSGAGICIEPENPRQFAEAVLKLQGDPAGRETMGKKGREFVLRYFNREEIARSFEKMAEGLCAEPPPPAASKAVAPPEP
jgi:glycosyltransferase involved in cell wall biosynthesis